MLNAAVRQEVQSVAGPRNIPPQKLLAVVHTESAGVVFWLVRGKRVPAARPEGHYFYARLKGEKLARARREGLAHPRAGGVKVPRSREAVYDMIERMKAIDLEAALESCSWGLGQVMGANWRDLGYPSVHALVDANYSGVAGQVDCMIRFVDKNNIRDELIRGDYDGFARVYNGPKYAINRYPQKMREYEAIYARLLAGVTTPQQAVSEEVRLIQKQLQELGYYRGAIDGRQNAALSEAVKKFQAENGMVVDGLYGTMTRDAVDEELRKKRLKNADRTTGTGGITTAISGIASQIIELSTSLKAMAASNPIITYTVGALVVVGVGLMVYGLVRRIKNSGRED